MGQVKTKDCNIVSGHDVGEGTFTADSLCGKDTYSKSVICAHMTVGFNSGVITLLQKTDGDAVSPEDAWGSNDTGQWFLDNKQHFPNCFKDSKGNVWVTEFDLKADSKSLKHYSYSKKAQSIAGYILNAMKGHEGSLEFLAKHGVYLMPSDVRHVEVGTLDLWSHLDPNPDDGQNENKFKVYPVIINRDARLIGPNKENAIIPPSIKVGGNGTFVGYGQSCYAQNFFNLSPVDGCAITDAAPGTVAAASEAFSNFYDGHASGWYGNIEGAAAAWNWLVADKYRPSLIDGAWETTQSQTLAFPLGAPPEKSGPHCKIISYQDAGQHTNGGVTANGKKHVVPKEVDIYGLYYLPITCYGQAVILDGDPTEDGGRPEWIDPSPNKLIRRVRLSPDAAFQDDVDTSNKVNGVFSSLEMRNKNHLQFRHGAVWTQSNCPMPLPNFMMNPHGGQIPIVPIPGPGPGPIPYYPVQPTGSCRSSPSKNTLKKQYVFDLNTFVPSKYHKYFTGADASDLAADEQSFISSHKFSDFYKTYKESELYYANPHDNQFLPKSPLQGQIKYLAHHYCDQDYTWLFWLQGWPESWKQQNVPTPDKQHTTKVNWYFFLDQLGLDVQYLEYAVVAGLAAAVAFHNHVNPVLMFTGTTVATLTGMLAYENKLSTWLEIETAYDDLFSDINKGRKHLKKGARDIEKGGALIITAIVGLGLTGAVMYGTYEELGAASAELLGSEFIIGLLLTGVAELVVWAEGLEHAYAKYL